MACKCIEEIEAKSPDHKIRIAVIWTKDNQLSGVPFIGLDRRDNGRPETRRGKPTCALPTYCPWCATPYADEAEA